MYVVVNDENRIGFRTKSFDKAMRYLLTEVVHTNDVTWFHGEVPEDYIMVRFNESGIFWKIRRL